MLIRTKIYLLLGFLIIPVSICAALLCYTLSDTSFGDVPWVTDFVGLTAERISEVSGITTDSLTDGNATEVGGAIAVSFYRLVKSLLCKQMRSAHDQSSLPVNRAVMRRCYCVQAHVKMSGLRAHRQISILRDRN